MSMPYFPMYPSDFEAKTSHLTLEEDGAYNRILRLMWMMPRCAMPDDAAWIARRMRIDADTFDRIVLPILNEFCERKGGFWVNPRLREEYEKADETYRKRSDAGKKGGRPKAIENKQKEQKAGLSQSKAGPKQPEPEPEPYSVDKSTGANAPIDPVKVAFDNGRKLLVAAGVSPAQAGSMVGKWRKDLKDDAALIDVIGRAQREGAVSPIEFIQGIIRARSKPKQAEPGDYRQNPSTGRRQVYMNHFDGWVNEG